MVFECLRGGPGLGVGAVASVGNVRHPQAKDSTSILDGELFFFFLFVFLYFILIYFGTY